MAQDVIPLDETQPKPRSGRHRARAAIKAAGFEARAEVEISTKGILAIGALVSAILLSVAPIVRAARGSRRSW